MQDFVEHPMRRALNDELHARKFNDFEGTGRFIRYVYFMQGHDLGLLAKVNQMLTKLGLPEMGADEKFIRHDLASYALRVERHTEFMSLSLIDRDDKPCRYPTTQAFDEAAFPHLPFEDIAAFGHPLFHAMWLEIQTMPKSLPDAQQMQDYLGGRAIAASQVSAKGAHLYCNFDIDDAGYSRMVLLNDQIASHRMGRFIQRAIELETYRLLALLSLPKVKAHAPDLDQIEVTLRSATNALADMHRASDSDGQTTEADRLLSQLTALAAQLEQIHSQTSYRFAASAAYQDIVTARLAAMNTSRLDGFQSIRGFLDKRMMPAMQTATAFAARMERLSQRIAQAGQLQRSQTELVLQKQNRDLLVSMNKRTSAQLRLQQTVEGLSIAAVTYYAVSLVGYLAGGAPLAEWGLEKTLIQALSVPVIAFLAWQNIKRVSRALASRPPQD